MIEIVINYDPQRKEFKAYEASTDTLFITTSLGETFLKLEETLKSKGLVESLLTSCDITYHIDSYVLLGLVENNVNLLKRLNQAPSGFSISQNRFGGSSTPSNNSGGKSSSSKKFAKSSSYFSKSTFNDSYKKFGNKK